MTTTADIDLFERSNYVNGVPFQWFDELRTRDEAWWQDEPTSRLLMTSGSALERSRTTEQT